MAPRSPVLINQQPEAAGSSRGRPRGRGRGTHGNSNAANRGRGRGAVVRLPPIQLAFGGRNSRSPSPILPVPPSAGRRYPSTSSPNQTMDENSELSELSSFPSSSNASGGNQNAASVRVVIPLRGIQNRPKRQPTKKNKSNLKSLSVSATSANKKQSEADEFHVAPRSIPKSTFRDLVRYVAQDFKARLRFQPEAFDALQEATEDYLVKIFCVTDAVSAYSGRKMILQKDLEFAQNLENYFQQTGNSNGK